MQQYFAKVQLGTRLKSIDQRLNYFDTWNFPDSTILPSRPLNW